MWGSAECLKLRIGPYTQWRNQVSFWRPGQVITMTARTRNYGIKKTQSFTGFPFICPNNLNFDDSKNQYF